MKRQPKKKYPELFLALNSGTSMDGVDACIFDFSNQKSNLIAQYYQPYSKSLKSQLKKSIFEKMTWLEHARISQLVTIEFVKTAIQLLKKNDFNKKEKRRKIVAIGAHGQTIFHQPNQSISIQLLNSSLLAEKTEIDVISDFRSADLAAGGEGAPLAPIFHQYLFQSEISHLKPNQSIAIVNLGGIGNITIAYKNKPTIGYDFAPANTLLDLISQKYFNQEFDENGKIAKSGVPNQRLLDELQNDVYFQKRFPKSTGIEYFSYRWLDNKIINCQFASKLNPADLLSTLTIFVARVLVKQIEKNCQAIYLSGGGSANSFLLRQIKKELSKQGKKSKLEKIDSKLASQSVECGLFAYLAKLHLEKRALNLQFITGARQPKILGVYYPS